MGLAQPALAGCHWEVLQLHRHLCFKLVRKIQHEAQNRVELMKHPMEGSQGTRYCVCIDAQLRGLHAGEG